MEPIYLQKQRMAGNLYTQPASGIMLDVSQNFWNTERILMSQVKEASS
jgi:hypothetical protein